MAAEIEFYDSDGTTLIDDMDWGQLLAGASSDPHKFYFKNVDTRTWQSVVLSIAQVGDNDGDSIARVGASSGSLGTSPVSVGDVDPDDMVEFWLKVVTTAGMTNGENPRSWDIAITETG